MHRVFFTICVLNFTTRALLDVKKNRVFFTILYCIEFYSRLRTFSDGCENDFRNSDILNMRSAECGFLIRVYYLVRNSFVAHYIELRRTTLLRHNIDIQYCTRVFQFHFAPWWLPFLLPFVYNSCRQLSCWHASPFFSQRVPWWKSVNLLCHQ